VFLADGGEGGASSEPSFSGTQTLRIEPNAIPDALKAFQQARDRVGQMLRGLDGLDIQPWAHDEVSKETAHQFAKRSTGGGADSARQCLTGYYDQLDRACLAMNGAHKDYREMDTDNSSFWAEH
jgi:hypothetical protein